VKLNVDASFDKSVGAVTAAAHSYVPYLVDVLAEAYALKKGPISAIYWM